MEKLTSIEQLTAGTEFHVVRGETVTNYEFLMIHPHNDKYILAIDSYSQEGKKLFIPNILGETTSHPDVYVGDYDGNFFMELEIKYHEKMIKNLQSRLGKGEGQWK